LDNNRNINLKKNMTTDITGKSATSKGMSVSTGVTMGTIIGTLIGIAAWHWWQYRQTPKDSRETDTGEKTEDGKPIVEVTGVGGEDAGVTVKGYKLPSDIKDVTLPLKVVVKPNKNLFLEFKAGQDVTFTQSRNEEISWIRKTGDSTGEYTIWYPELRKVALGAIKP